MNGWKIEYLDAEELAAALPPRDAVAAIRDALDAGLDPAIDPPRAVVDLPIQAGQMLAMPSASSSAAGVKVLSVAADNPARGLPRIQGVYLLFAPTTLELVAGIDGPALTTLRTPAVSVAAVLPLLTRSERGMRVVVFGAGPQGVGHVQTLRDVGVDLAEVTYVVRNPSRLDASRLDGARVVPVQDSGRWIPDADIVVCATTSSVPVFDSRDLKSTAVVMAVGAHEPDAREVDAALVGRSQVVVEDITTALRECGDVVLAIEEGVVTTSNLIPMADVVRGEVALDDSRPVLFKGSGMSWQDLVVAEAAMRRRRG
jgi:ornithine cyclodeaminase/alanine dehydrogenase-like protein (mu-crystallin family)